MTFFSYNYNWVKKYNDNLLSSIAAFFTSVYYNNYSCKFLFRNRFNIYFSFEQINIMIKHLDAKVIILVIKIIVNQKHKYLKCKEYK